MILPWKSFIENSQRYKFYPDNALERTTTVAEKMMRSVSVQNAIAKADRVRSNGLLRDVFQLGWGLSRC
jgi:hypothetical protein